MRATAAFASLQHLVVVGVDRDVGVHVAVAGVHVQRDEHAAAQHVLVNRVALLADRLRNAARRKCPRAARAARSSTRREGVVLQRLADRAAASGALPALIPAGSAANGASRLSASQLPAHARFGEQRARTLDAVADELVGATATSPCCSGRSPQHEIATAQRASFSLLLIDSSMLMRSMPSV